MKLKKAIYVVVGCLGVGLGAVGAVVPMLPAFPFLMLAAFCFAKSSRRLHTWFTHTKLYRENLADYVSGQGMTWPAKKRVMLTVTLLMAFGFILMRLKSLYVPCLILGFVWAFHILEFVFGVKTKEDAETTEACIPSCGRPGMDPE